MGGVSVAKCGNRSSRWASSIPGEIYVKLGKNKLKNPQKRRIGIWVETELGAPVADVVDADELVAHELERARQRVADDGGTQVAHVHLLGDVRRRVIDHHL